MLTIEEIKKIDSKSMYSVYDNWPKIAEESYSKKIPKIDIKDINHVVFAGMGGSGAIGDIFSSILSKSQIHVSIVKGYHLPKTVNNRTLVVCTSISGETNETLSILKNYKNSEGKFITFSSGGKMEDYSKKNNIDFYKIKKEHSPRASFLGFLYSTLNVLEEIIPINESEVRESVRHLVQTKNKIDTHSLNAENEALKLANWIKNIPIIYYPWGLQSAAIRFKNSMQENSKKHVLFEDVIEASHNGIVSWEKSSNIQPILMQGKDDHFKTRERWKIFKEFFTEKNIDYQEIFSVDSNILSKLVCLVYTLDMTSLYNAVIEKIDPTPVTSIDFIKSRL